MLVQAMGGGQFLYFPFPFQLTHAAFYLVQECPSNPFDFQKGA